MRKYLFALTAFMFMLHACNKNETLNPEDQSVDLANLPTEITDYLDENYPDTKIAQVVQNTGSAEISVVLNTAEELTFDTRGNRINTGSFVFSTFGTNGGGHLGGGIPVDSLPVEITDFISQNYAAYTIRHARFDSLCQFGDVTEVVLSMDSIQPIKLYFDADNLFVAVASRVLTSDLPELITAAVAAAYPEYTLRSKSEIFTLQSGSLQFKVFMHLSNSNLSVVIDESAVIICEQAMTGHGSPSKNLSIFNLTSVFTPLN